jgi:hypothetical protein
MRLLPALLILALAAPLSAQTIPSTDDQIAAAVLPLPENMRAAATVMGYKVKDKLEVLRPGTNGMNCLALYVTRADFHVACYHKGLEPFMARGREIRATMGAKANVDSIRFAEVASGKLKMPATGALYTLSGEKKSWDPATKKASKVTPLSVVYIPGATEATTGLSAAPLPSGSPWLMFPGTAKAHIMLVGSMTP